MRHNINSHHDLSESLKNSLAALLILRMLSPGMALACSACTFQMFEKIFPFITVWLLLFLVWTAIFILWHIVCPKGKALSEKAGRIIGGLVLLFLVILFTGLSFLLFCWALAVGRLLWLSWKNDDYTLSPGVRKFSMVFNGFTSIVLLLSVAAAYAGYDLNRLLPGSPPATYRTRAYDAAAYSDMRNARNILEEEFQDQAGYPTLEKFNARIRPEKGVVFTVKKLTKKEYFIISGHEKGAKQFAITTEKPCMLRKERTEPDDKFACIE